MAAYLASMARLTDEAKAIVVKLCSRMLGCAYGEIGRLLSIISRVRSQLVGRIFEVRQKATM